MIGVLAATTAAGVAGLLGYASMAPQSQLFGRSFTRASAGSKMLALTFDDGPNVHHTLDLLELLDRHSIKATFFMLGKYVRALPELAQAVARAGHVVGNHTYSHPNLIFCTPARIRLELALCERTLTDVIGAHSRLCRPPFGGRRPDVLHLIRQANLEPILWSVTAYDWTLKGSERILQHVARQVRGGDVILLHDGGHLQPDADRTQTIGALRQLIPRYRDQGFVFSTVPEMMRGAPEG